MFQVGPIGTPTALMAYNVLPWPRLIGPVTMVSGPMWATSLAYTGASRHMTTITRKMKPKNIATRLRRRRRHASA